jgi:hypothetical protein
MEVEPLTHFAGRSSAYKMHPTREGVVLLRGSGATGDVYGTTTLGYDSEGNYTNGIEV